MARGLPLTGLCPCVTFAPGFLSGDAEVCLRWVCGSVAAETSWLFPHWQHRTEPPASNIPGLSPVPDHQTFSVFFRCEVLYSNCPKHTSHTQVSFTLGIPAWAAQHPAVNGTAEAVMQLCIHVVQDVSEGNSLNGDPDDSFLGSFVLEGAESTTGALERLDVSYLIWYLILLFLVVSEQTHIQCDIQLESESFQRALSGQRAMSFRQGNHFSCSLITSFTAFSHCQALSTSASLDAMADASNVSNTRTWSAVSVSDSPGPHCAKTGV